MSCVGRQWGYFTHRVLRNDSIDTDAYGKRALIPVAPLQFGKAPI